MKLSLDEEERQIEDKTRRLEQRKRELDDDQMSLEKLEEEINQRRQKLSKSEKGMSSLLILTLYEDCELKPSSADIGFS